MCAQRFYNATERLTSLDFDPVKYILERRRGRKRKFQVRFILD